MKRRIPTVRNGILHEDADEVASLGYIAVESDPWYIWLERHRSFRFECSASTFTARKEQRSGSWYWYAYRRQARRLHTAYLGRSAELSMTRLEVIATELAASTRSRTLRKAADSGVPDLPVCPSHEQENVIISEPVPLHNLPLQLTSLVGREQEVATAMALLHRPEVRLLSMVGTAGVGKTRLALQVATDLLERFADGVFFVALAPVRDAELVLSTVAQTLGLKVIGDQPILDVLKTFLRDKYCLLILDNFEQVVSAAPLLSNLLEASQNVKLLVTSREVLRLRAEYQFSVPPLALPGRKHFADEQALAHVAAVELFLQRAQAIRSDFHMTRENEAAIAEVCIRLDGLPLAIELAAARINVFPPQALLARLDRRLQVLIGGARDLPERQRTLRSTIEWSYELLPVREQRLFRRLAVFVGGCTPESVEEVTTAVGDTDVNVLEEMISLVDKSLLQQTGRDGEEPRFAMLETIREYALERLEASDEAEAVRRQHATFFLLLAEEAEPELVGPQQAVWLERLEREYGNLRATLQWSLERGEVGPSREMALRLAGALQRFWEVRGHWSEGRNFLERVLAGSEGFAASAQVKALKAIARLAYLQSDIDRAEVLYEECLARCRELGDTAGIALSIRLLGGIASRRGNFVAASARTEESLALFREVGDKEGIAWSLFNLAERARWQGEYTRAISLEEESLAFFREMGHKVGIAVSLSRLAEVHFLSQGDPAKVHMLLEEDLVLCREMGHKEGNARALNLLGEVFLHQGDAVKARSLLEESMMLSKELGERDITWLLIVLGKVTENLGDYPAARVYYEESLAIGGVDVDNLNTPFSLEGLAGVVAIQGDPAWAAQLWGASQALREARGTPIPPVYRADYKRAVAATRLRLGEKAFAATWAEGRTMTAEQALTAQGQNTLLQPLPAAPAPTPATKSATPYPDGLTAREVEVLRLLATGLTSAQIAEQLIIGVVTVNFHVRSIYSKLGVSSRSAATRYAIEHKLV